MNDTTTTTSFVGSIASPVGFWAALVVIAVIAFTAFTNSFRRDGDGLVHDNAGHGIVTLIAAPLLAVLMIGVTSGVSLPDFVETGAITNRLPELAQRIHDSRYTILAITAVSVLWAGALCSSLYAILLRRRQQRGSDNSPSPA
ncbi:hypothetical protein [Mycolicibacterium sp.]|uniref:hypothetical protein n=1 Tax=Mycolicibacterium sp. TaxID=2320850 RepID=UPI0037CAB55B